jgi:hypothetical protein
MHDMLQLISLGWEASDKLHSVRQPLMHLLNELVISDIPSTWHPYGFLVTRLGSVGLKTFRLHIWPETPYKRQSPDWPIHSHPWEMQSLILHGQLVNCLYSVSCDNSSSKEQLYEIKYDGKHSVLHSTSRFVSSKLSSREVYATGESYFVHADEFHTTDVKEGVLTATLAVTFNANNIPPRVIGRVGKDDIYRYERKVCDKDTVSSLVGRLGKALLAR